MSLKRRVLSARNAFLKPFCHGKRVALVSSNLWKGKVYDDLLLQRALMKKGAKAEIISWQDSTVDYRDYDVVVITSMWGYQNHLEEFEDWLKMLDSLKVRVFNSTEMIRENCDKIKQIKMMDRNKLPHIATKYVSVDKLGLEKDFPFVLKPAISASGQGTRLVRSKIELSKAIAKYEKAFKGQKILKQEFRPEIKNGEVSVVLVRGKMVNAVRRFPGVIDNKPNAVEVLDLSSLEPELVDLCKKVAKQDDYKKCLYLRVDTVKTVAGYLIMEIEAFEPQLFYYLLKGKNRKNMLAAMVKGILC